MSLIVTLHGEEGVVMASDSRATFTTTSQNNGLTTLSIGVSQSDAIYKTFLAHQRIGISYCGDATIGGVPLAGFVETFINEKLSEEIDVDSVPSELLKHFTNLSFVPDTIFHVAGYQVQEKVRSQKIWRVFIRGGQIIEIVPARQKQGLIWNGEIDVLTRIRQDGVYVKEPNGIYSPLAHFGVPFEMFTLQDMIDFAVYTIRTTSDAMRFQMRSKTVGGPIDILVIKPTKAFWIQRKELKYNEA